MYNNYININHGSSTSTSSQFLNRVNPKVAIISVGAGNRYGHPDQETIDKLNSIGAVVYRTDINGTVVVTTDGYDYSVSSDKEATASVSPTSQITQDPISTPSSPQYVGSKNSDKYHLPGCSHAKKINPENQVWFNSKEEAEAAGYTPCSVCNP